MVQRREIRWRLPEFSNSGSRLAGVKSYPNQTISYFSNVLQEAKPAFSVFFSVLSLAVDSCAALNLQLSFLFLTKTHQPWQAIEALRILKRFPFTNT
jgi:hypothetical protein